MNKTKTYYQPMIKDKFNGQLQLVLPYELFSFQAFRSEDDAIRFMESYGYRQTQFVVEEYHDEDIEGVTILDAEGGILETNKDDMAMPEHRVKIGEKVFDYCKEYVCEVVKFLDNGMVLVNKGKFSEHNRNQFDLDEAKDEDEWEVEEGYLYQFADGMIDVREGMPVCIEHMPDTKNNYPYYSPYLQENLFSFEVNVMAHAKNEEEYFTVIRVSRADFEAVGYDASGVSDVDMEHMAMRLGETLLSGGDFWLFLKYWGEEKNLPKIEKPE